MSCGTPGQSQRTAPFAAATDSAGREITRAGGERKGFASRSRCLCALVPSLAACAQSTPSFDNVLRGLPPW